MDNVTHDNNFCRVFELPDSFPVEFCFGGGHPVEFKIVDWFQPVPWDHLHTGKLLAWPEYEVLLRKFLKKKLYYDPDKKYILITNFNKCFLL